MSARLASPFLHRISYETTFIDLCRTRHPRFGTRKAVDYVKICEHGRIYFCVHSLPRGASILNCYSAHHRTPLFQAVRSRGARVFDSSEAQRSPRRPLVQVGTRSS